MHPIPELKAVVGKEFSFICPASGYPIDRISWTKGKINVVAERSSGEHERFTI